MLLACIDPMLYSCVLPAPKGDFLEPDEVTFAVLLRGYGARSPPDWQRIDACLTTMKTKYGIEATAGGWKQQRLMCLLS